EALSIHVSIEKRNHAENVRTAMPSRQGLPRCLYDAWSIRNRMWKQMRLDRGCPVGNRIDIPAQRPVNPAGWIGIVHDAPHHKIVPIGLRRQGIELFVERGDNGDLLS